MKKKRKNYKIFPAAYTQANVNLTKANKTHTMIYLTLNTILFTQILFSNKMSIFQQNQTKKLITAENKIIIYYSFLTKTK